MGDARAKWLRAVEKHKLSPAKPDSEKYWSSKLETASKDETQSIQSEKLRAAVEYVYECIPFYRRKFDKIGLTPCDIRSIEDLPKIPVTTKHEIADDLVQSMPWGTYTGVDDQVWCERGWQIFASSGTTGVPRVFRYTQFDRDMWAWMDARAMWAMGFRPKRDVAILAFGYGPHVWLWGVHYALNLMGIPILTAGGIDTRGRVRFITEFKPTILACTPSYSLYLASVMRDMGYDPASTSVKYLFCAGEPGFSVPATRQKIEETWGAEMHEFYGCTEAAPSAGAHSCQVVASKKAGAISTHVMPDTHIWETVEPRTYRSLPYGQRGLSLVTNLCSESSPQLRFLVGDYTTFTWEPCECGRTSPRTLGGFLGRADDMLNVRGVTLFPSAVEDAVRRVAGIGEEFQIIVTRERELDVLTVQVEPHPSTHKDHHPELLRLVEREIISRCELRPVVQLVPSGSLPKTEFKAKRVQDLRTPGTV
jgi:phenylacetate-CoA ligase